MKLTRIHHFSVSTITRFDFKEDPLNTHGYFKTEWQRVYYDYNQRKGYDEFRSAYLDRIFKAFNV